MKEKPILFLTPMVQAILEGRKTQTRRVIKPYFFLGRPPLETSLILSTQSEGYMAVGPAYPEGLIPAFRNRIFAAFGFIPSAAPISLMGGIPITAVPGTYQASAKYGKRGGFNGGASRKKKSVKSVHTSSHIIQQT